MDTSFFEDLIRFDFDANELWSNFIYWIRNSDFPDLNRHYESLIERAPSLDSSHYAESK
jgi:hypothetical protein